MVLPSPAAYIHQELPDSLEAASRDVDIQMANDMKFPDLQDQLKINGS